MKPYELNDKNILVIPDLHQNIEWAKHVLKHEAGNYNHILFLGDFFDSFLEPPDVYSVEDTCWFIKEIIAGKYGEYTLTRGNHDIIYEEASHYFLRWETPARLLTFCSGYTNEKAKIVARLLTPRHWARFETFKLIDNKWLISHAGFTSNYWKGWQSNEENLDRLYEEGVESMKFLPVSKNYFHNVSYFRGGRDEFSGPFWLDFREFKDELPYAQIVGHTPAKTVRQRGGSFCLDGNQTYYGIIKKGELEIKNIGVFNSMDTVTYFEKDVNVIAESKYNSRDFNQ